MGETGPPPPPVVLAGEAILTLFGMVGAVPRVGAVKEEEEHPKTGAIGTESDGLTIPYVLDAATLFLHRNLYVPSCNNFYLKSITCSLSYMYLDLTMYCYILYIAR